MEQIKQDLVKLFFHYNPPIRHPHPEFAYSQIIHFQLL